MSNTDPVLQRTWQFDVNNTVTGSTAQSGGADDGTEYRKQLLMDIKEKLVSFAMNPWTVSQSHGFVSGIVTAPTVGSASRPGDNWDPANLEEIRWVDNPGVGVHSWIVLRNAALGMELCLDQVNTNVHDGAGMSAYISPVAFPFGDVGTGGTLGTTTARPTSGQEVQIADGFGTNTFRQWGSGASNNVSRSYALHVLHSNDGLATRVLICLNGEPTGFWFFDRVEDQVGAMTYPFVARIAQANDNDLSSITTDHLIVNPRLYGMTNGGLRADYYMGLPANNFKNFWNDNINAPVNSYDGRRSLAPVCVASQTPGFTGLMGLLYDTYYQTGSGYTGRGWPGTTNALMQFDVMVFPWNMSIPIVS